MTKKEFCEIMAAGHKEASVELFSFANQTSDPDRANRILAVCKQERALARAFRDLAKEQPE